MSNTLNPSVLWRADQSSQLSSSDALQARTNIGLNGAVVLKGSSTVAQLNAGPAGLASGWQYTVSDSGTLTAGSLIVVAGDKVVWNGTAWENAGGVSATEALILQGNKGIAIPSNADLNSYTAKGNYFISSAQDMVSIAHTPFEQMSLSDPSMTGASQLAVFNLTGSGRVTQMLVTPYSTAPANDNAFGVWYRHSANNTTWGSWYRPLTAVGKILGSGNTPGLYVSYHNKNNWLQVKLKQISGGSASECVMMSLSGETGGTVKLVFGVDSNGGFNTNKPKLEILLSQSNSTTISPFFTLAKYYYDATNKEYYFWFKTDQTHRIFGWVESNSYGKYQITDLSTEPSLIASATNISMGVGNAHVPTAGTAVGSPTVPTYVDANGTVRPGTTSVSLYETTKYKISVSESSTDMLAGGPIYAISIRENGNRSHSGFIFLKGGDYGSYTTVQSTLVWVGFGTQKTVPVQLKCYTLTYNTGTYEVPDKIELYVETGGSMTCTISLVNDINSTLSATTVSSIPSGAVEMPQHILPYVEKASGENFGVGDGSKPVYVATNGRIVASSTTVGSTGTPVYLSSGKVTASPHYGYMNLDKNNKALHITFTGETNYTSFKFRTSIGASYVEGIITFSGNSGVFNGPSYTANTNAGYMSNNLIPHMYINGSDMYLIWKIHGNWKRVLWNVAYSTLDGTFSVDQVDEPSFSDSDLVAPFLNDNSNHVTTCGFNPAETYQYYDSMKTYWKYSCVCWHSCSDALCTRCSDVNGFHTIPISQMQIGKPYVILLGAYDSLALENDLSGNVIISMDNNNNSSTYSPGNTYSVWGCATSGCMNKIVHLIRHGYDTVSIFPSY